MRNWLGRYLNPHQKQLRRGFIHFLLWRFGFYKDGEIPEKVPDHFLFPNREEPLDLNRPKVVWVNHSTFWIELDGKGILVDPIWSKRCSPFPLIGPKRHHLPTLSLEELPSIDYVVLSHNHYDHMDRKTIVRIHRLYPNIIWITPHRLKKQLLRLLPDMGEKWVVELKWWEEYEKDGLKFTAVPAQHFSGRGLFDRNLTLWMGCIIESQKADKRFYFVGDTGYNDFDFKKIGEKFGQIDLSLIPIGTYFPRQFMKGVHINPEESVKIHRDVKSKLSIGGHFGTFKLSPDSIERPPFDLYRAMEKHKCQLEEFRVLKPGQFINW
ncbi:MAG: hypothetical protein S4CHLAM45_08830 [Chlamydiales bacterium]|nr:hypothetical protein [Chlamydiales bacterium]MCH9620367.1 hypothetical protein [Chlamydiales bacterium]MCH9622987.1 hypothetical protein [Chlamydiales bacterium]